MALEEQLRFAESHLQHLGGDSWTVLECLLELQGGFLTHLNLKKRKNRATTGWHMIQDVSIWL